MNQTTNKTVLILTEINPHADGVHCGRCNKIEFDTDCAEFQVSLELDNELCMPLRCAKCLAAQKEYFNLESHENNSIRFDELKKLLLKYLPFETIEEDKQYSEDPKSVYLVLNSYDDMFLAKFNVDDPWGRANLIWDDINEDDDQGGVVKVGDRFYPVPQPENIEQELKKYDNLERQ